MEIDTITVGLDIKNEGLRGEFEEIIASQHGFRLTKYDPHRVPELLISELDEDRGKTFSQVQAILGASPSTEIFLTSAYTDSEVLLEVLRAGVKEFIPQPINRAELEEALLRFKERHREKKPAPVKRGKLLTLIGSKGGVGTTTGCGGGGGCIRQSMNFHTATTTIITSKVATAFLITYHASPVTSSVRRRLKLLISH